MLFRLGLAGGAAYSAPKAHSWLLGGVTSKRREGKEGR